MIRSDFDYKGRKLVGATVVVEQMQAAFQAVLPVLSETGRAFSEVACSSETDTGEGFVHYQGVVVDDPLFGQFILRLELQLRWKKVNLWLVVYRPIPDTRKVSHVIGPALAYDELAEGQSFLAGDVEQVVRKLREFVANRFEGKPKFLAEAAARLLLQVDSVVAP